MIRFDDKYMTFHMSTPKTSYVSAVVDGSYLGHVYYGPRIDDMDLGYLMKTEYNPFVPSINSREKVRFMEAFPKEYAGAGTGDMRSICFDVRNEDGQAGLQLAYVSHHIFKGKPTLSGLPSTRGDEDSCDTLEILLTDSILSMNVYLYYTVYRDLDVITRSVQIENSGASTLFLTNVMSAMLDLDPTTDMEVITLHGSWARERRIERTKVDYGTFSVESIRGESGPQDNPFMALVTPNTTQTTGQVYAMNLVYSGNFLASVQKEQYGKLRMMMGINPWHFTWKLMRGQTFTAPECVMVFSNEGLGEMTRTLHRLYRHHLIPKQWETAPRPVLVNNWEATEMDFDLDTLLEFAREAKTLGMDMLVMDDGWFGERNDDSTSLGDWFVNEKKLPGGLKALSDKVHEMDLRLGIWIEPEMTNSESELFKAHPDWVYQLPGREPGLWREQLVLDITRPEVFDGVYSQIKKAFETAQIDYVKWDMNRPLCEVGNLVLPPDQQGELMHRYTLAVYRMQEQLLTDFPDILFENCSSGGARFDPGMLYYSPQIWTSDNTDAIERLYIQEGTAICYPLSSMGAHVSACPNGQTRRTVPFDTRAKVAMAGTFGYELDTRNLTEEERSLIPGQIEIFRKVSPVVVDGDYYRLASYNENGIYDSWAVVSRDKSLAYMTYVQVKAEPNKKPIRICMQGLDPDKRYSVRVVDPKPHVFEDRKPEELADVVQTLSGGALTNAGLIVPRLWDDYQALLYEIEEVQ